MTVQPPQDTPGLFRQLTTWPGVLVGVFLLALVAVAAFLGVRLYLPSASYTMSSEAMLPTLAKGDILYANGARACLGAAPKPGDVVVIKWPPDRFTYIQRAVAGPGDRVELKAGRLIVNGQAVASQAEGGQAVRETLANGATYRTLDTGASRLDDYPAITLAAGTWFLLGDNRDNASDSRVRGPVSARNLCGVITAIIGSADGAKVGRKP
jgi:signal peptidase I